MEKIRFIAIIDPYVGNGKRYGVVACEMINALDKELVEYSNAFYRAQGIKELEGCGDVEATNARLALYIEKNKHSHTRLTLMTVNGEPVAIVMNTRYPKSKYASFWNFYVKPEHRSKGYGNKLIQYVMEQHRAAGYVEMGLTVHSTNPRAEALYRRYGFEVNTKEMFVAL